MAILFGCQKFHQYIYGKDILVESDHKPLQDIFQKSILNAPKRLQRMMITLQDYNLKIVWKPGKLMIFADLLSRKFLNNDENNTESYEDRIINVINEIQHTYDSN